MKTAQRLIELARERHGDDDEVEVDGLADNATIDEAEEHVSRTDGEGTWVRAWVWVDAE